LRFKHFSGSGPDVERAINQWLEEYNPDITHVAQSAQDGGILISFLFDESFRGQELRISQERHTLNATVPAVPADSIPDKPLTVSADE
jgi:hypothetical protein